MAGTRVGAGVHLERKQGECHAVFQLDIRNLDGYADAFVPGRVGEAAAPVATLREAGYFAEIVLARFTAFGLGLTMLCILLTIVLAVVWRFLMALSDVINRKWVEPQKEKYFASRKDAWEKRMREEVRNQVQDEASAAWRGWLNRRDAAAAKGDPFDEPAPDER